MFDALEIYLEEIKKVLDENPCPECKKFSVAKIDNNEVVLTHCCERQEKIIDDKLGFSNF